MGIDQEKRYATPLIPISTTAAIQAYTAARNANLQQEGRLRYLNKTPNFIHAFGPLYTIRQTQGVGERYVFGNLVFLMSANIEAKLKNTQLHDIERGDVQNLFQSMLRVDTKSPLIEALMRYFDVQFGSPE